METIGIIGSGKMGTGITQFFLENNIKVILFDIDNEIVTKAKQKLSKYNQALITTTEISKLKNCKIIFEAATENLKIKEKIFKNLEKICNDSTIFCTNTSGISISKIASSLSNPQRFVGTHFFMPANIIPLVEIIIGENTNTEVAEKVYKYLKKLGKKPVLVKKDVPGFIANRLQHAMAREALSLLQHGVASAEDIDLVAQWSLGIRLATTGPLKQRDLNGLDIHLSIAEYLYPSLENSIEPLSILKEKVKEGNIGYKSNQGFYNWDEGSKDEKLNIINKKLIETIELIDRLEIESDDESFNKE